MPGLNLDTGLIARKKPTETQPQYGVHRAIDVGRDGLSDTGQDRSRPVAHTHVSDQRRGPMNRRSR